MGVFAEAGGQDLVDALAVEVDDLEAPVVPLDRIGGVRQAPEQDLQPYVPMRGRKIPGDGALPLAAIVARVHAHRPDLPVGVEVLSDEMDALGPITGAKVLADACRRLKATTSGP